MMDPFLCFVCSRTSFLDERFRCIHCGNGLGSWSAVAENLPVPEPENASPGWYVPASNAGNQKSEEYFMLVEPTLEANTHVYEENADFPLQISARNGYENCSKIDDPSQNKTSHAFDQYSYENHNLLPANSNINEGEFHSQYFNICNAPTLLEAIYDTPSASQQTYLSEESSVSECENKSDSDELLGRQGTKEFPTERGIKFGSFVFTDSTTLESEYPAVNLLSDSSMVEDRHENILPPFSSCPRGNPSVNKCFQENMVTASRTTQKKHKTSSGVSRRWCENCGKFFLKQWTFHAHMQNICNSWKPYKCGECGEVSRCKSEFLSHKRVHTGEKPFKCTQCDYASVWPDKLKTHMKKHADK